MASMTLWLPRDYRAETSLEVKRSRFVTTLARVDSEDAARAVVADVRRAHPAARHHCSAFVVEVPDAQPVERSSDDGEPAGTAGMPMLEVLRGAGVSQAVAVVARYFGGVLLGTGGLVRAYSESVTRALNAAPRVRPLPVTLYRVEVDHADYGRLQAALIAAGLDVVYARFAEAAEIVLAAPAELDIAAYVARLTRCGTAPQLAGEAVIEVPLQRG